MKQKLFPAPVLNPVVSVADVDAPFYKTLNRSWRISLAAIAIIVNIGLASIPFVLVRSANHPKVTPETAVQISPLASGSQPVAGIKPAGTTPGGSNNPISNPIADPTQPTNPPIVTPPVIPPTGSITHGSQINASNTGFSGSLNTVAGFTASTAGQTYQDINVNGDIDITAANVTIKNCKINAVRWYGIHVLAGASATIENCEIYGTIDRVTGVLVEGTATIKRVNVHDVDIGLYTTNGAHMTVIESYVHDLWAFNFDSPPSVNGGSHNDSIKGTNSGNVTVIRCRLVAIYSPGKTAPYAGISGNHHVEGGNVIVQNSLLDGTQASYVEYAVGGAHLTSTGNILIHPDHRHAVSLDGTGIIDQWSNNTWSDGSAAVPGG